MTWRSLLLAGAELALAAMMYQPQAHSQQGAGPKPAANALGAEVRHIHIWVTDVERTKAFYREKLGFPVANETPGAVVEFSGITILSGKPGLVNPGPAVGEERYMVSPLRR